MNLTFLLCLALLVQRAKFKIRYNFTLLRKICILLVFSLKKICRFVMLQLAGYTL